MSVMLHIGSQIISSPTHRYHDPREIVRDVCGDKVVENLYPFWGLDEEGELSGVWRYCGHERLWYASGESHIYHNLPSAYTATFQRLGNAEFDREHAVAQGLFSLFEPSWVSLHY